MSARDYMQPDAHAMSASDRVAAGLVRAGIVPDSICNGSGLTRYLYLFGDGVRTYICIQSREPDEDEVSASQAVAGCVRDRHITSSLTFNHTDPADIDRAIAWMLREMGGRA